METALLAAFGVAMISVLTALVFAQKYAHASSHFIIPLAVGVFLSVIFFELLPETFHAGGIGGSIALTIGFLLFLGISRVLQTFHHHHEECSESHDTKTASRMVLLGDGVHNFTDGIVIGTAFMVNPAVGIATTIGIALHEVPQEIVELSILLNAGYSRTRAVIYNFLSALTIVLGVAATFLFLEYFNEHFTLLIGFVAGSLLYIAASDLLPRLNAAQDRSFWYTFCVTTLGLILMAGLLTFSHEYFGHEEHDTHEPNETESSQSLIFKKGNYPTLCGLRNNIEMALRT